MENKDFWYKVEPKKESPTKTQKVPDYTFDSIESEVSNRKARPAQFWSRRPSLHLGGGYLYNSSQSDAFKGPPLMIALGWTFRDRGWHRISLDGWFTFRSQVVVNALWQFTSSRKALRSFYGLGASLDWQAQSQIRALIEPQNYWLVLNYGYELLITKNSGFRLEGRGALGIQTRGLSLIFSYIRRL